MKEACKKKKTETSVYLDLLNLPRVVTRAMLQGCPQQPHRSLPAALAVLLCFCNRKLVDASATGAGNGSGYWHWHPRPHAASSNSSASWEDGAAASAHNNPWPQVPWQPIFGPQALMFLVVLGAALCSKTVREVAWWKLLAAASAPISDTVSDSLVAASF